MYTHTQVCEGGAYMYTYTQVCEGGAYMYTYTQVCEGGAYKGTSYFSYRLTTFIIKLVFNVDSTHRSMYYRDSETWRKR